MSWTYRVVETPYDIETIYSLCEYYDMPHGPAWTVEPIAPIGDDIDDLIWALEAMTEEAKQCKADPGRILPLDKDGNRRDG